MQFVYKNNEIWQVDGDGSILTWSFSSDIEMNYNRVMGYLADAIYYNESYFPADYHIPSDKSKLFLRSLHKIIIEKLNDAINRGSRLKGNGKAKTQIIINTSEIKSCVHAILVLLNLVRNFERHIAVNYLTT